MKYLLLLVTLLTFVACQKEIETQEEFFARTERLFDGEKLAVSVDFIVHPEPVTAFINRYDSIGGQQVLVDKDTFHIPGAPGQWSRHLRPTGFPYKGNLQVKIMRDSTGAIPYERWVTLTNANGLIINLDTTTRAVSGHVGLSHVLDVVPKHYQ